MSDASQVCQSVLEQVLRQGAQSMLQAAIEIEVQSYLDAHKGLVDESGRRLVVGNGSLPGRRIQTGFGPVDVKQPRVHDRRPDQKFTSAILPPDLRRAPSLDNLIPALYLKGVSMADLESALSSVLGPEADGLSSSKSNVWSSDGARSAMTG